MNIALRTFGTHSPRGVGIGSASHGAAQNGKGENRLVMPELVSGPMVLWSWWFFWEQNTKNPSYSCFITALCHKDRMQTNGNTRVIRATVSGHIKVTRGLSGQPQGI